MNIVNHAYKDEAKTANESSLIISISSHIDILANRDIQIANSDATSHNIPHGAGLQDVTQPLDTDSVIVGTSARVGTAKVGNIKSLICDKYGNVMIQNANLQDVIKVPESKFNLLSIPVFLEKGW